MYFYDYKDLKKTLSSLVNQELQKINKWFEANKLCLNVGKTKYSLLHKPNRKDGLPLLLPSLLIKKREMQRVKSIKFLGVLLDENLSSKDHIKYIENKVAENIGLLYRAKLFLDKNSLQLCKFIAGQYKQNKSEKATLSTKPRSTNYQQ